MYTTIRTSQQYFTTDPERWLGKSAYFDNLFSGKWGDEQEDGSYFIETDARIFEHILRYLRTGVLPVFYDKMAGHDFPLYQALLEESMYFAIDRLQEWLCERRYLKAVTIRHVATETQDRTAYRKQTTSDVDGCKFMVEDRFVEITTSSNVETSITPITVQKNSFYCPWGKHGRSTEEYCRSCFRMAKDDNIVGIGRWKSAEQLKLCIVRREITFNHKLCVEASSSDSLID